jgi:putative nucleotidyltransferase with HDIG domain
MKISIAKKKIELGSIAVGVIFFSLMGFAFYIYSINISLLFTALLLYLYVKFFRRMEELPPAIDLAILGALAVLMPLLVIVQLRLPSYLVPVIGFIALLTILFENIELSLLFSFYLSLLVASVDNGNFNVMVSLLSGVLSVLLLSYRIRRRSQVIRSVIIAGAIQCLSALLLEGRYDFFVAARFDFNLMRLCGINILISLAVVWVLQPFFEYVFKVVTSISLLELSDFNRPLLRRLILEAPGTYQHSLVVANLSESAAETVGANSLLARVGAYYHDIGKMAKPEYFVENLVNYKDVHKNLKPSMSKIIIFNHVKDGLELAAKYRLNPKIVDFISQHHGRSLVYYFYQRAKELEPEAEHEEEYRYPGPKPQTKETAIVSLADSVEALSRTLDEPTPARIEEMVKDVVKKRFMEGELDESNLTLKDLEQITQSFIRILNAIFHTRINYPRDETILPKTNKPK